MGVVCGKVSRWIGKLLAKTPSLRLGWGIEWNFWTNQWCGDLPPYLAFPVLYNIATNRAASIDSSLLCQGAGDRRTWDVRFIRGPNDWEAGVVDGFFRFLASNLPSVIDGDRMRWKLTKNGDFNIHLFYHKLSGSSSVVIHEKVFGRLRHLGMSISLFEQPHGIGFSRAITCGLRFLILLTSALCVVVVGS